MKACYRCGKEWVSDKRQPGVKEFCDACMAYLHCCLNCRFHDPHLHNQCKIPNTEWVGDRAGGNFCDEFEFVDAEAKVDTTKGKQEAKDAFLGLFGASDDDSPKEGSEAFKKLFGD